MLSGENCRSLFTQAFEHYRYQMAVFEIEMRVQCIAEPDRTPLKDGDSTRIPSRYLTSEIPDDVDRISQPFVVLENSLAYFARLHVGLLQAFTPLRS
jgi:hypothetical protein